MNKKQNKLQILCVGISLRENLIFKPLESNNWKYYLVHVV